MDEQARTNSKWRGFPRINGWRRICIVLYAVYFSLAASFFFDEIGNKDARLFFDQPAKQDNWWEKDPPVKKEEYLEWLKKHPHQAKKSDDDLSWLNEHTPVKKYQAPEQPKLSFDKVFFGFIGYPLLTWLFFEIVVAAIRWIIAGFRNNPEQCQPGEDQHAKQSQ